MPSPIALVSLITADVPPAPGLGADSWLLAGAATFYDLKGYMFLADGLRRGPDLGPLFANVPPDPDGGYTLELGVCLPDMLPNLGPAPEYTLDIRSTPGPLHRLCFSNVMARLRYETGGEPLHALVPRAAVGQIRGGGVDFIPKEAAVEVLRTFATARFRLPGATAEEALDGGLEGAIHEFLELLNRALQAMPVVTEDVPGRVFSVAYSRASFDRFYFILKGGSPDALGHGWVAPHLGRAMLNPYPLPAEQAARLTRLVSGAEVQDDVRSLMYAARSFLDGGVMEYVLLLSVVAAEVATRRYVHGRLLNEGVSKSKLGQAEKDMTYSMMLNALLAAVAPAGKKPDPDLLGKMNRARDLRNGYMHKGLAPADQREMAALYEATKTYIAYLESLAAPPPTTP